MNQKTMKYIPLCVAVLGVALGLHLRNQAPAPTSSVVTVAELVEPTAVAKPGISLRDGVEMARNARVRLMLGNQDRIARAEKLPGGKELVERLKEQNREAEEAYREFLKSDAEYRRLQASLAKLQQGIREYRQTNPGQ